MSEKKQMNGKKRMTAVLSTTCCLLGMLCLAPAAVAAPASSGDQPVAAVRSFPAQKTAGRVDFYAEATSVSVGKSAQWGGLESLSPSAVDAAGSASVSSNAPADASSVSKNAVAQYGATGQQSRKTALRVAGAGAADGTGIDGGTAGTNGMNDVNGMVAGAAAGNTAAAGEAGAASVPRPDSRIGAAVAIYAASFAGKVPYVWGGDTPAGWDCSGFTMYVFAKFGVSLPHSSRLQGAYGVQVPQSQARPGDLMVEAGGGHVGIYLGDGLMVHAASPQQGTVISPTNWARFTYYRMM